MTIVKIEETWVKGKEKISIQIRYRQWDDDYGGYKWTHDVYYKHMKGEVTIKEHVVTPCHYIQLSDIFDCPPYFDAVVKHFSHLGFTRLDVLDGA